MVVLHRQIGKLVLPRVAGRTRFTPNRNAANTQSPRPHAHLLLVKMRYKCFINAGITRLVSKVQQQRWSTHYESQAAKGWRIWNAVEREKKDAG